MPRVAAAVAALSAALAAWVAWFEPRRTVVRRQVLRLPGWPAELDGMRVGLIGDLHAGAPHVDAARVRRVARRLARRRPELLLLAGDFVDVEVAGAQPVDPRDVAAALAIDVPLGRFAVLGNHDVEAGARAVEAALRGAGIAVLHNASVRLEHGGAELWLAAIADDFTGQADPQAALRDVPPGAAVLALTHSPDVFPRIPQRVALTVAGHTHGGQVALPGLRARWTPSRFGARYAGGLITEDGRHLYVTTGVGTSRFPLRLGAPPEVVLLVLRTRRA